jgi:hypothetical protein
MAPSAIYFLSSTTAGKNCIHTAYSGHVTVWTRAILLLFAEGGSIGLVCEGSISLVCSSSVLIKVNFIVSIIALFPIPQHFATLLTITLALLSPCRIIQLIVATWKRKEGEHLVIVIRIAWI